ncbi:hypothetical protein OG403_01160 [Kitasatospora sp. NBC_01266]
MAFGLRIALAVAAALGLTVLFVFCFKHDPNGPASRVTDAHLGDPAVRLYEGIVYAYLGSSTVLSAKLFWSNRRSVPPGPLRAGVLCLAGGSGLGFVYTVYRVIFLAQQRSQAQVPGPGTFDPISEALPAIAILLVVAGLALPPVGTLARYARDQYALWRLYPLWSGLIEAEPTVAFGPRISRIRDLLTLGDRSLDLAHRAFEIRDASLVLRDLGVTAPSAAGWPATERAAGGETERARAEAAWLFSVLHGSGHSGGGPATPPPPPDARTPAEEVSWLFKVAAAYDSLRVGGRGLPQAYSPVREDAGRAA